ncbi:MAG: hypothetical protein IPJ77_23315 [Planctomycetes bacterium]|nr:hypothetical protein [Planctomycetota bacterium]
MKVLDRWTYDPVVRGLVSTGNVVAAVFLVIAWYGKSAFSSDVWPMAFALALVPLRGDAHQRFWDYARTEWLHASGFVSRARLATACVLQELVEALLRAGVIVLLTVQIRSVPKSASLYSWLTLGCTSWVGMFAAWAGVLLLVRASWSLAVNFDVSRAPMRHGKIAARRNDASEDSFGPIALVWLLGWIGLAVALLELGWRKVREPGTSAHFRGSLLVRLTVALAIALPPCALGLWLESAWIPAVFGAGVLVLLGQCVYEKEFATSLSTAVDGPEDSSVDSESEPIERSTPPRTKAPSTQRSTRTARHPAIRTSLARAMLWRQIDRRIWFGLPILLIGVLLVRWGLGPPNPASFQPTEIWWGIPVLLLFFVPGRVFRWVSSGEQAEFFVAHGRGLGSLRRVEMTAGLGLLAALVALYCLLIAGVPRAWTEWACLLVACAQVLLACNESPLTRKLRVRDATIAHGVVGGLLLALFLEEAGNASAMWGGLGFASASFLIAASLWVHGWWSTFDEQALRTREVRFAEAT